MYPSNFLLLYYLLQPNIVELQSTEVFVHLVLWSVFYRRQQENSENLCDVQKVMKQADIQLRNKLF